MREKCGIARQTTDDNTIRRMRVASWITTDTDTHSEHVTCFTFPRRHVKANAPQFYIKSTLSAWLHFYVFVSIRYTY